MQRKAARQHNAIKALQLPRFSAPQPGRMYVAFKRMLDIVGSLIGTIAFTPLLLGCALLIRLSDGGPVLYKQWRVGRDGVLFEIYKLRTMTVNAEKQGEAQFASSRDPRIIAGCRWMRRSHVDELPQLWNILIGDMSLVGPRPERPEMFEVLRPHMPRMERRLTSRPGLTGLAQVRNGYTNDLEGSRRKLAYDLRYLRSQTILGELRLVFQTIPKIWDRSAL